MKKKQGSEKMKIYKAELETTEPLLFASKEVSEMYITVPYIHNYTLTYALGLAESSYIVKKEPSYQEDIKSDIYITPAVFYEYRWHTQSFNTTGEGYYLKMERNNVVDLQTLKKVAGKKIRAKNVPQIGIFKMIAAQSKARFYVLSEKEIDLPRYIRLGKLMSKCKVIYSEVRHEKRYGEFFVKTALNPIDIPKSYNIKTFSVVSMKPSPIIHSMRATGEYLELVDENENLPQMMKYFVFLKE
ncbi:MAG: CRISPR-associated protein Csc1 [Thermotogaceae bacterium]|jgi:CRISPR-associated protein Csc1|nr:CRISPR-associated protein Csc1 [Thermotogaceae bacterium]